MATRIFDHETLLDLVVNAVPLFIMAFFVAAFVVFAPFGFDPLASGLQLALVIVPFLLLLGLTYFAAKAVSGAEKSGPVYLPGQTTPAEAEPIEEEHEADPEREHAESVETVAEPEEPGEPTDDENASAAVDDGATDDGGDESDETADDDTDEADDETDSA